MQLDIRYLQGLGAGIICGLIIACAIYVIADPTYLFVQ